MTILALKLILKKPVNLIAKNLIITFYKKINKRRCFATRLLKYIILFLQPQQRRRDPGESHGHIALNNLVITAG